MKKNFGEGIVFTITNYIWWFLMGNFYFWIMNIPFIVVYLITSNSGENDLGMFLVLSAIPMGPALTALFSVMGKLVREKDVDITKDFFKAYKTNFFESLFFWSLELLVIGLLYIDKVYIISKFDMPIFEIVFMFLIFMCINMIFYIFPIISRFYFKKAEVIKISIYYLVKKFYVGVIGLGEVYIFYVIITKVAPVMIIFSVGMVCYIIMFLFKNTMKKMEEHINNGVGL